MILQNLNITNQTCDIKLKLNGVIFDSTNFTGATFSRSNVPKLLFTKMYIFTNLILTKQNFFFPIKTVKVHTACSTKCYILVMIV